MREQRKAGAILSGDDWPTNVFCIQQVLQLYFKLRTTCRVDDAVVR